MPKIKASVSVAEQRAAMAACLLRDAAFLPFDVEDFIKRNVFPPGWSVSFWDLSDATRFLYILRRVTYRPRTGLSVFRAERRC